MSEKENRRKCIKCGASPAEDGIKLFRALKPGVRNLVRCEQWAKYVFPEKNVSSIEFQKKLYNEHRMLCERHFKDEDFTDSSKKKLLKTAVPCDVRRVIINLPNADREAAGPSIPVIKEALAPTPVTRNEVPNSTREVQFSWEQDSAVVPCDDGAELSTTQTPPPRDELPVPDHTHYKCNICRETITGFRYTCVQCLDVDLCGACEARQAHHAHYVLRIPESRPPAEVAARLRAIRRALLADGIANVTGDALDADVEVKDEPSQEDVEMNLEDLIDIEQAQTETIYIDLDQDDPLNMDQSQGDPGEMESGLEKSLEVECQEDLGVEPLARTNDDGTIDRSPEESFSKLTEKIDLQLKPVQYESKLTAVLPSNTHPVQTQSKSLPVVKLTSSKTLPMIPQEVFTIQESQSKLNTVLRRKPTPTINTNETTVNLGKVKLKPIMLRNRKEQKEKLLKMLKRTNFNTRQQPELLKGNPKIAQQPSLESSSTENKRIPEIDFWPIVKVKKL